MNFISVALGGALGAVLRYTLGAIPLKMTFPLHTLIINIVGAIVIGFIVGLIDEKGEISHNTELFWKTGVCGGFTTFSTFSLESVELFEKDMHILAGIYIILSITLCLFGIFFGKRIAMGIA